MSTSITAVTQLVTLIQSQLKGAAPAQARQRVPVARASAPSSDYAASRLGSLIQLRVRQIARDDPQRGRKAFRVFLEAVLLAHFGEALANDPKFYQLLDDIESAMSADPASSVLVEQAIGHLLNES